MSLETSYRAKLENQLREKKRELLQLQEERKAEKEAVEAKNAKVNYELIRLLIREMRAWPMRHHTIPDPPV